MESPSASRKQFTPLDFADMYIPISQELINHVKRVDSFNEEEMIKLKTLLYSLVRFEISEPLEGQVSEKAEQMLQFTLKLHQVLALLNVDLHKLQDKKENQLLEILSQLSQNGGLDYLPRERTPQGRLFDHASDCRILTKHLHSIALALTPSPESQQTVYYIRLEDSRVINSESINQLGDTSTTIKESPSVSTFLDSEDGDHHSEPQSAFKEKDFIFSIPIDFLELTLKSNGKADLYFHAYFWYTLIFTLYAKIHHNKIEQDFDKEIISQSTETLRLKGLAESLKKVHANLSKFPFNEEIYHKFVNEFGGRKQVKKLKLVEDIQRALFVAQISDDREAIKWIEKLLVQLLGYYEISIRDQAVILLNMLYDGVDWQLQSAFRPVVRIVGQHFKVNLIVDLDLSGENKNSQVFLGLSAPSPIEGNNQTILTWHKIDQRNVKAQGNQTEISINFGKFWKCGFYDWRLVQVHSSGRLQPLEMIAQPETIFNAFNKSPGFYAEEDEDTFGSIAQGRFIVHAKGMRDHIFHEVYVDYQNADVDTKTGKFNKRGDFSKVEKAIEGYKRKGITALYLMGVLERDNYPYLDKQVEEIDFRKPDATPLAITCRQTANKMLGGDEGFQRVLTQAQINKVKIIIDCLTRISSSRSHRKYRDLMLYYLDEDGRKKICYGTDGQSINYEDTALLNYRKVESWDLLIQEVLTFASKHNIDGIHLDNGQAWPQIMEPDLEELMRFDVDGQPAYTPMQLMDGEIVIRNENYGYWNTNTMETYPNPFFIKMGKTLWSQRPDFMIIGECWGGYRFENRQIILARSGVIPRQYKLPQTISSIFGKRLFNDGRVEACQRESVLELKKWYETSRRFLPEGAILIQSSSAHQWPYPAYLYGKGTWAAVDILYFMSDIPITFMGEIDGEVYRIGTTQVFQHEQQEVKGPGFKRTNSQLMMALHHQDDKNDGYKPSPAKDASSPESKRALPKVRSGSNLAALVVEQKQGSDLKAKEEKFKVQIGPQHGFDLSKISSHYEHRRRLRREKMVLRYGELIPLVARNNNSWEHHVLAFARYSLLETALVATNLNDNECSFWIDISELQHIYLKTYSSNTVVMVTDWLKGQTEAPQYYFLKELLQMKQWMKLKPYHSAMLGITICQDDPFVLRKALTQSLERTKQKLQSGQSIESEQISLLFTDILEKTPQDIIQFANVIGGLQETFLDKLGMKFYDLIVHNQKLRQDPKLASRLLALCSRIVEISDTKTLIPPVLAAKSVVESNKLGPIVFCTPELGRWSTVGGLGVMVDELAYGLSLLGEEVWVISPYYERNRKGETGYLARDPAGITYKENINITVANGGVLGVHEGMVNGVHVVFLHNADIFPVPYADLQAAEIVRQLAVFGKGCLEFCCKRALIPSLCITNDWFTGMIPAYAKVGAFGETFKGTTFFHIVHNLEPSYEGRIFPQAHQGAMEHIHQLPRDWLVDPYWKDIVINPSRCALMLSDQWGTVSPSYKEDLLNTSPLRDLLKAKPNPFAFPNGIPIEARVKKLNEAAPDHQTAKKLIQMKYFGYGDLDDEVPLLSFVGRITTQKGVHLILEAAESLIHKFNYKINILVGGAASMRERYSADCAHKMWNLKHRYPNCFWADPNMFFTDGSLVNRGSDFGLMPSVFEPGGIVQHEFFVGGTPVIAFKTGGLKDTVTEFKWDTEQGNGYTFEKHSAQDFLFACERALGTYKNKAKYLKLRENAFQSTMDGERVSKAWLSEFYRLRGKVFIDQAQVKEALLKMGVWSPATYKGSSSFEQLFGIDKKIDFVLDDIDFGAEEEKEALPDDESGKVVSAFENAPKDERFPHVFMMHNSGPRYHQVHLCGTFDDWKTRHQMSFDNYTSQWFITLHLLKGTYHYKYVVNNQQWVVNDKEPKEKDKHGNLNNVIIL